jgi:hypothetical protein
MPDPRAQTKTLFSQALGNFGILLDGDNSSVLNFTDAHAALDWCVENHTAFYYLPPDPIAQN